MSISNEPWAGEIPMVLGEDLGLRTSTSNNLCIRIWGVGIKMNGPSRCRESGGEILTPSRPTPLLGLESLLQSNYSQPLDPPTTKAIDPQSKSIADGRIIEASSAFWAAKQC